MDKQLALEIIKLLSALETAGLMYDKALPSHIYDEIARVVEKLTDEVLK